MRQWIEVFTGDLRHLLIEYDESIDNSLLMPYFDVIMQEDEALRGGSDYSEHLQNIDDTLYKEYVIQACRTIIKCIEWGEIEGAERLIKEFNLKVKIDKENIYDKKAISKLEKRIKQIKTSLKIKKTQEKEESKGNKKTEWEELIVYIHRSIGIEIKHDCTVKQYRAYEKEADRSNKAKNKK